MTAEEALDYGIVDKSSTRPPPGIIGDHSVEADSIFNIGNLWPIRRLTYGTVLILR